MSDEALVTQDDIDFAKALYATERGTWPESIARWRASLEASARAEGRRAPEVSVETVLGYEEGLARGRRETKCEPMHAGDDGWCGWIHPLPGYLMQCCDCDLIHEVQFEIVPRDAGNRELNPGEDDGHVIIFRMRRHPPTHPKEP